MNAKIPLAACAAVAAAGVALYAGLSATGSRPPRSAPLPEPAATGAAQAAGPGVSSGSVSGAVPPERLAQDMQRVASYSEAYDFPSTDDALGAFADGVADLTISAEKDAALSPLGLAGRRGLIETWSAFMHPILTGDRDAFVGIAADLGASEIGAASALFDRLASYLGNARLALGAARISDVPGDAVQRAPLGMPRPPGNAAATVVPLMVERRSFWDERGEGVSVNDLKIPLSVLFPHAAEAAGQGARTVEVWAPAKLTDEGGKEIDIAPAMRLVYDEAAGAWTPLELTLELVSDAASSKLEAMIARRRGATP